MRLGLSGFARSFYGTFTDKSSLTQRVTRLGLSGYSRQSHDEFSDKSSAIASLDIRRGRRFIVNVGTLTTN